MVLSNAQDVFFPSQVRPSSQILNKNPRGHRRVRSAATPTNNSAPTPSSKLPEVVKVESTPKTNPPTRILASGHRRAKPAPEFSPDSVILKFRFSNYF